MRWTFLPEYQYSVLANFNLGKIAITPLMKAAATCYEHHFEALVGAVLVSQIFL